MQQLMLYEFACCIHALYSFLFLIVVSLYYLVGRCSSVEERRSLTGGLSLDLQLMDNHLYG